MWLAIADPFDDDGILSQVKQIPCYAHVNTDESHPSFISIDLFPLAVFSAFTEQL